MGDIKNPKLLWLKSGLFSLLSAGSAALLMIETPTWKTGLLLALTIWASCRAYYFVFYVIEHYVDSTYRYSGLLSLVRYLLREKDQ